MQWTVIGTVYKRASAGARFGQLADRFGQLADHTTTSAA